MKIRELRSNDNILEAAGNFAHIDKLFHGERYHVCRGEEMSNEFTRYSSLGVFESL